MPYLVPLTGHTFAKRPSHWTRRADGVGWQSPSLGPGLAQNEPWVRAGCNRGRGEYLQTGALPWGMCELCKACDTKDEPAQRARTQQGSCSQPLPARGTPSVPTQAAAPAAHTKLPRLQMQFTSPSTLTGGCQMSTDPKVKLSGSRWTAKLLQPTSSTASLGNRHECSWVNLSIQPRKLQFWFKSVGSGCMWLALCKEVIILKHCQEALL